MENSCAEAKKKGVDLSISPVFDFPFVLSPFHLQHAASALIASKSFLVDPEQVLSKLLIHHLLYSKPSCVYGDDVKTSPF